MPLVSCAECGQKVSSKAAACPQCGCPLGGTSLVEWTAKRWKVVQLVGGGIVLLGAVMVAAGFNRLGDSTWLLACVAVVGLGLMVAVVGAVAAWWFHG